MFCLKLQIQRPLDGATAASCCFRLCGAHSENIRAQVICNTNCDVLQQSHVTRITAGRFYTTENL